MKKTLLSIAIILTGYSVYAQTNIFPSSGFVGIGITNPSEALTLRDSRIAYDSGSGTVRIRFDSGGGGGGIGFEKESFNTGGLRFYTQYGYGSMLEKLRITAYGDVGIGTTAPDAKLAVNGLIHTQEVRVDMKGWSDYVFKPTYKLLSLAEVKTYIDLNHHLPEMPSEQQVVKDGIQLGEMNKLMVKKIEELTLYLIDKDKQVNTLISLLQQQQKVSQTQQEQINQLQKQLNHMSKSASAITRSK